MRNVEVVDIVVMADYSTILSKWTIGRVIEVYPGTDGRVHNVTKIAFIYLAEGNDSRKLGWLQER